MLTRPLAAAVLLGLLFCGATVSLEAFGLLFRAGVPDDPQQRIEAFVARLEADLSPVDLPTEPVELPHDVAQGLPGHDAEHETALEPARHGDGASELAEMPDQAEPDGQNNKRLAVAFSSTLPNGRPETEAQPDESLAGVPAQPPQPAHVPAPLPAVQVSSHTPEAARPVHRVGGARQARPSETSTGYAAFGWPVLDWLIW